MEKPRQSSYAWTGVVAGIYLYDRYCKPGEQLSERADQWMEHPVKKWLFSAAVGALALHLTNRIDPKFDMFHYLIPEKD